MNVRKLIFIKKMKKIKEKGFTLVELLIVIALIAILSVAVLATINPIEQSNKAKDSTTQNDAAEVMNALERYYTVKYTYPWMDSDSSTTVTSADAEWFGRSDTAGFGLCAPATSGQVPSTPCSAYNNRGFLISTDELKDSFLNKGYTSVASGEPNYLASGINLLWVNKLASDEGNSVLVCYIPKAKSNRTKGTRLYKSAGGAGDPLTGLVLVNETDDFGADGYPNESFTFATPQTSMFKCVP